MQYFKMYIKSVLKYQGIKLCQNGKKTYRMYVMNNIYKMYIMHINVVKHIYKSPSKYLPVEIQLRNTGRWCKICAKLTIKTSERRS